MHTFWGTVDGDQLRLDPEEIPHALKVLRLQPGDALHVLDGSGTRFTGVVRRAHKKEVIAKGGTPVDALDSWQKKKMKKEEVEVKSKVEESTKLFYKLQAKGKGRSSTAKAQTTRDSNLEDQKSAKMRRQQAKQRQEREGDDKYGHPSLSAAERNPSMR